MKVALVGTGFWGMNHLRSLRAMVADGRLSGLVVFDTDKARAQAAAKEAGCEAASNLEALMRDGSIDAVDIVTPTPSHYDLARRALDAGKHVLVEKPMTATVQEAQDLVRAAERADRLLMPGHLFRYHPGIEAVREALTERRLGEIRYISASRQAFREPRPDMGVLPALGVHELDLFAWLLDRDYPDSLSCTMAGWQVPGVEEVCWIQARFGDISCHATESWVSPWAGKERHLAVFGERGAAQVDFQDLRQIRFYDHGYETQGRKSVLRNEGSRTLPLVYKEPLAAELTNFIDCAVQHRTPTSDMHSGLRAVEMVDACFRSAKEGKPVALK